MITESYELLAVHAPMRPVAFGVLKIPGIGYLPLICRPMRPCHDYGGPVCPDSHALILFFRPGRHGEIGPCFRGRGYFGVQDG